MEVGQLNKLRIGAIIQARMKSTRLPGKIVLPLPLEKGKPLIVWIIDELKKSKFINEIVLSTSKQIENNNLRILAKQNAISFFAGDENNVLSRFVAVIKKYELDIVIRITGDNPIIDINLIDKLIETHYRESNDYTYSEDLPLGMNIEVCKAKSLCEIYERKDLVNEDFEHVTFYFKRTNHFKIKSHSIKTALLNKDIRLTVDYPVDFILLNVVVQIALEHHLSGIALVSYIDNKYSWLWDINNKVNQKKHFLSLEEELPFAIKLLGENNMKFSQQLLKGNNI